MAAPDTSSRRTRRRALRTATKRRVRGGERLAPRPVQHIARQVDDAAFAASTRMRRLFAGDRPFLLGMAALLALGVLVLSGPLQSYLDQRDRVDLLERQLGALELANADLQQRADDLEDPVHQELLARERFGFIRPGEVPYVVVPPERDRAEISSPLEVDQPEPRPWFRGAWDALTGLFG